MTPGEHARDMVLRLAAVDPSDSGTIERIIVGTVASLVRDERERCARIAEKHAPMVEVGSGSHITLAMQIAAAIRNEA